MLPVLIADVPWTAKMFFFAGGRSPDLDFTLLNAQSALGLGADLAS